MLNTFEFSFRQHHLLSQGCFEYWLQSVHPAMGLAAVKTKEKSSYIKSGVALEVEQFLCHAGQSSFVCLLSTGGAFSHLAKLASCASIVQINYDLETTPLDELQRGSDLLN